MKNAVLITLLSLTLISFSNLQAQDLHNNCAASYLGAEMVASDYSPRGTSTVSKSATGILTFRTIIIEDEATGWQPSGQAQSFMLAIKDKRTGTIRMYTEKPTTRLDLAQVLRGCEVGDQLLIITIDPSLANPHPEITVTQ